MEMWVLSNVFQFSWTDTVSFKTSIIIDPMSQRQLMVEADIIN